MSISSNDSIDCLDNERVDAYKVQARRQMLQLLVVLAKMLMFIY
jgi:hypothetical protein